MGQLIGGWLVKNETFCLQAVYQISKEQNLLRNATCCNVDLISDMCCEGRLIRSLWILFQASVLYSSHIDIRAAMWHMHTKSSDLWTNKAVLPKDRIWPPGGGTRHFLPTSALLLSPSMVCVCVMWLVLCFRQTQTLSVPQGQRVEDEPYRDRLVNRWDTLCVTKISSFVPPRDAYMQVSIASKDS